MKKNKKILLGILYGIIVAIVLFVIEHYFFKEFPLWVQSIVAGLIVFVLSLFFYFIERK